MHECSSVPHSTVSIGSFWTALCVVTKSFFCVSSLKQNEILKTKTLDCMKIVWKIWNFLFFSFGFDKTTTPMILWTVQRARVLFQKLSVDKWTMLITVHTLCRCSMVVVYAAYGHINTAIYRYIPGSLMWCGKNSIQLNRFIWTV